MLSLLYGPVLGSASEKAGATLPSLIVRGILKTLLSFVVRVFSLVVFPASMAFMSAIEIEVPMKDSRDTMNVQGVGSFL